ncbi:MAG: HEAT repeat domain-containing protein [Planctomycetes bacterium]|nr:HEAT repeat domain-containing protein [Planctomycetota bacterium]
MIRPALLLLVLAGLCPAQSETPSKEDIDALKSAVSEAKKAKDTAALAKAFNQAIWLDDGRVAKIIAPFIADKNDILAKAAIKALRYHQNDASYKALVKAEGSKDARKRPELRGEILLAIGQSGEKKAIPTIVDAVKSTRESKVRNAASMALAHIRHNESVDAAIKLLTSSGRRSGRRGGGGNRGNRADRGPTGAYLTLHYLTIKRNDSNPVKWKKWWKENRSHFKVPKTPAGVEQRLAQRYERTWRSPTKDGQRRRRR